MRDRFVPRRPWRALAVVAAVLAVPVLVPTGASAAPAERHCVLHVTGQAESGEFTTDPIRCYSTFDAAMASIGVHPSRPGESAAELGQEAVLLTITLAIHYDGAGGTGSSLVMDGISCSGGYKNLSASWIDRISSTYNGCSITRHYTNYDLGGSSESTSGVGTTDNLVTSVNNAANSVQYG